MDHGILDSRCGRGCVPFMEGSNIVNSSDTVKDVIEGEKIQSFFENLLEDEVMTFDYKWMRGIYRVGMLKYVIQLISENKRPGSLHRSSC